VTINNDLDLNHIYITPNVTINNDLDLNHKYITHNSWSQRKLSLSGMKHIPNLQWKWIVSRWILLISSLHNVIMNNDLDFNHKYRTPNTWSHWQISLSGMKHIPKLQIQWKRTGNSRALYKCLQSPNDLFYPLTVHMNGWSSPTNYLVSPQVV